MNWQEASGEAVRRTRPRLAAPAAVRRYPNGRLPGRAGRRWRVGKAAAGSVKLIERAQAAGEVRPHCETQDFGVVQIMVGAVIDAASDVSPELWRRYLRIALQGLRPEGATLEPLPVPAVRPRQMDKLLVGAWKRRRS